MLANVRVDLLMVNADLVLDTMLEDRYYSAGELAHLSGVDHYVVSKILIHLDVKRLIMVQERGLLPRKRRFKKIMPVADKCSPDILPKA